jgi:hypothetical protein
MGSERELPVKTRIFELEPRVFVEFVEGDGWTVG